MADGQGHKVFEQVQEVAGWTLELNGLGQGGLAGGLQRVEGRHQVVVDEVVVLHCLLTVNGDSIGQLLHRARGRDTGEEREGGGHGGRRGNTDHFTTFHHTHWENHGD